MALKRILLPVLMVASTTAIRLNDEHQSMAAEDSKLNSDAKSPPGNAEVTALQRENSMLQRQGKVGIVVEGDWVFAPSRIDVKGMEFHQNEDEDEDEDEDDDEDGKLPKGTIGKIVKVGGPDTYHSCPNRLCDGDVRGWWLMWPRTTIGMEWEEEELEEPENSVDSQMGVVNKTDVLHLKKLEPRDRITVNQGGIDFYYSQEGYFNSKTLDTDWYLEEKSKCWESGGFELVATPSEHRESYGEGQDFGGYKEATTPLYVFSVKCNDNDKLYYFNSDFVSVAVDHEWYKSPATDASSQ